MQRLLLPAALAFTLLLCSCVEMTPPPKDCEVRDKDVNFAYTGGCKDGYAEGYGVAKGESKIVAGLAEFDEYRGMFHNGIEHGKGLYIWAPGSTQYDGDWVEGHRTGKGTFTRYDFVYEGDWVNGKWDGVGTLRYNAGPYYIGDWKNGKRNGFGTGTEFRDTSKKIGLWKEDAFVRACADAYACGARKTNGPCQVVDQDIAVDYAGQCKDGFASGAGVAKGRDQYRGTLAGGLPNGKGTYTWASGTRYAGGFNAGARSGFGILSVPRAVYNPKTMAKHGGQWTGDTYVVAGIWDGFEVQTLCPSEAACAAQKAREEKLRQERETQARLEREAQERRDRVAQEARRKQEEAQARRDARRPRTSGSSSSSGSSSGSDSGPTQVDYIMVTADIQAWGNYDIALRIDNYNGSPDGESPGYISDKSEWWHSKTIGKGYNGRIGGRYKFEVKFRNVRNVVCTGTFSPDSSKRTFKIQLHEDCTDAGSNAY